MFINYANSPDDKFVGNMNHDKMLYVNSCGTYKLYTRSKLTTFRPKGRMDYQLIYISSGKGYFFFDSDSPTIVDSGHMILYHPNELQKYTYYGKDHPDVYWIHFTGSDIPALFREHGIDLSKKLIFVGKNASYAHYFERIILELQLQKKFYEESCVLLFTQLIIMVGRFGHESALNIINTSYEEIDQVRTYFHEHYHENINIEAYIEHCGLSTSSFFRKFKQYTAMTPLQYLLDIRLSNAQKLLETTDYSINEIASIVGYENALYFSRLFHKHIGLSPKAYRESIR